MRNQDFMSVFTRLGLLSCIIVATACGGKQPAERGLEDTANGRFHIAGRASLDDPQRQAFEALKTVGYLSGSRELSPTVVITRHEPEKVQTGVNLYTSGHAAEAFLVGMDGTVLHSWKKSIREVWPSLASHSPAIEGDFWRRAYLYPDGTLIAIYAGVGIVALDRDSNVVWSVANQAHHDMAIDEDGLILTLTRSTTLRPEIHPKHAILEDKLVWLDSWGKELKSISMIDALLRSEYASLLDRRRGEWDVLHTNTIELLDGRHEGRDPALASGRALVSWREIDAFGVLDLESGVIVKTWSGDFRRQHDPKLLENGDILLFDNSGAGDVSRVIQIDPMSGDYVWNSVEQFQASFYSETCGAAARLANGNTLVTESDGGRAMEFTPTGELVWEFYNPHRAGDNDEYIATLFEMVRLPEDFGISWRAGAGAADLE